MSQVYFLWKEGMKEAEKSTNLDELVERADREQAIVFIWNTTHTGVHLVYSWGERKALANVK